MFYRPSWTRQAGARYMLVTALCLVLAGCDTNPGGPSAPTRAPAPGELTAPEPHSAVADAKKALRGKARRKPSQQPDRAAAFE
jgi:hypothetical protein